MDVKSSLVLEVKRNDYVFRMELPIGATLGDAHSAACEMINKIVEMIQEATNKMTKVDNVVEECRDE